MGCQFQFQSFPHMLGYGRCSVAAEEGLHETRLGRPSRDYDLIPSCVHSSFVNFPGVNLSFNNSLTRSGTVVLLPLLKTVVSRSTSFIKSPYIYRSPVVIHIVLRGANYNVQRLQIYGKLSIDQALDCRRTEVSSSQGNVRGAWTGSPAPSAREASTSS